MTLIVGTAGWSVPAAYAGAFGDVGPALERYASRFRGVEINSSFHRSHRPSTWARWAAIVPDGFQFAVKMPKTITHQRKLVGCADLVASFIDEVGPLGAKLAVLLVQLPPKLSFEPNVAAAFLRELSILSPARIACEPRHASWFEDDADSLLAEFGVARVAADPALIRRASLPGGSRSFSYWRLHGSPIMYRSAYGPDRLGAYGAAIDQDRAAGRPVWCMFDNTASSAATGDALALLARLRKE